jgi:methyl-accepting chemotaxis protein
MLLKNCSLNKKILLAFFVIGIIPFLAAGFASLKKAGSSLQNQSFNQLESIREIKKRELERYFSTLKNQIITFSENSMVVDAMEHFERGFENIVSDNNLNPAEIENMKHELLQYYTGDFSDEYRRQENTSPPDMGRVLDRLSDKSLVQQYYYIKKNPNPLGSKDLLGQSDDYSEYSKLHGRVHPVVSSYREKFGYYDIFLVSIKSGNIVYSVFKELDFSTSLLNGPYADTNFAEAFRQAAGAGSRDSFIVTDFARYLPSYDAPAGFIASPIYKESRLLGVAVFQFPIDKLNDIMGERTGMGKTGETYLVGPDRLMRSDSFLDPENHTVSASFKNPDKGTVDTFSVREAFSGRTGKEIIKDYNGNRVLSAYTPLRSGDISWALIAEIDEAEAFASVRSLRHLILIIGITGTVIIIFASLFVSSQITGPIKKGVHFAESVSEGDLSGRLELNQKDEIGILATALNSMAEKIGNIISDIKSSAGVLDSSSGEMSEAATLMTEKAGETREKAHSVSASAEEMSVNMNVAAAASEQASANFQLIASAAEQMGSTIKEIARNTEMAKNISSDAVDTTRRTSERVNNLRDAADKIGKITGVIKDIMDQTNLLALNATIEAARAGQAGKSFGVVANEIKELASQTSAANSEINSVLSGMQGSTDETVSDILSISSVIENVNSIVTSIASAVEEQSAATGEIVDNLNQAAKGIQEITEGVTVNSAVADEISKNISEVNTASGEFTAQSDMIKEKSGELSGIAGSLNEMVNRFRVG